jgi:DNA-binding transcriptional LysR family regulator
MDLDKLRVFHAVAQAGSFTHAGEQLALSQSAVSRQISALEDDLRVPLFTRHARGLILTEQGELLFRTTRTIFEQLLNVEEALLDSREVPRGDLRVTATTGIGVYWLAPRLHKFISRHPDVNIRLIIEDGELDLAQRQADIALRMRQPVQSDLIQRKLFDVHYHVYASRDYVRRRGQPSSVADLDSHAVIVYGDAPPELKNVNWLAEVGRKVGEPRRAALYVNNIIGMGTAIETGVGIGALPDYFADGKSEFVRVMSDTPGPSFEVHLCYPENLRGTKRVAVFRDFLVDEARNWSF